MEATCPLGRGSSCGTRTVERNKLRAGPRTVATTPQARCTSSASRINPHVELYCRNKRQARGISTCEPVKCPTRDAKYQGIICEHRFQRREPEGLSSGHFARRGGSTLPQNRPPGTPEGGQLPPSPLQFMQTNYSRCPAFLTAAASTGSTPPRKRHRQSARLAQVRGKSLLSPDSG